MLSAMLAFTVLDASGKFVLQSLSLPVAVFFRYFIALILASLLISGSGGKTLLKTHHPILQMLRGFFLLSSTMLNFVAMSYLQLAQTAAISFTIPLWVCALSVPLLGEHVGIRRWTAVLVGFLGILVIMRPGTQSFHWAMLCSLGATLNGALYNITTRKVGAHDGAETSLLYVCLFGSLGALLPATYAWATPQGWQWLPLILMGFAGAAGHFMLIKAHRIANAAVLAPFAYTQIIWMIIAGYLLFKNIPDFWTLVGASIVIASNIYIFARERIHGQKDPAPIPSD